MTNQLNVSERARKAAESLWYGVTARLLKQSEAQGVSISFAPFDRNGHISQAFAHFEQDTADRVRELEAALEPFADKAAQFSKQGDGTVTIQMDFAHFRRALATLRSTTDAAE